MSQQRQQYPPRIVNFAMRSLAWAISKTLWSIRFRGLQNIPARDYGAFIVASNHQTYVDPAWICIPIKHDLRFMAIGNAFTWRFIGPLIEYLGAFPVSPDTGGTLNAMKSALRTLKDGAALVVFPEGERVFADGALSPFKEGVVRIAAQAEVPILPVTIVGGNRIWPRGQKYPRLFRKVTVVYHPLIQVSGHDSDENIRRWNEMLRDSIASAM